MTPKKKNPDVEETKADVKEELAPEVTEEKEDKQPEPEKPSDPEVIEAPEEEKDVETAEEMDAEDESLTLVEKFVRYETETKIGMITMLIFLIALIFRWDWINTTWWLVLILGAVGIKTLYTQMTDLKEDKPSEAKISRISFIILMILLVVRDLYITSRLDDFLEILSK